MTPTTFLDNIKTPSPPSKRDEKAVLKTVPDSPLENKTSTPARVTFHQPPDSSLESSSNQLSNDNLSLLVRSCTDKPPVYTISTMVPR